MNLFSEMVDKFFLRKPLVEGRNVALILFHKYHGRKDHLRCTHILEQHLKLGPKELDAYGPHGPPIASCAYCHQTGRFFVVNCEQVFVFNTKLSKQWPGSLSAADNIFSMGTEPAMVLRLPQRINRVSCADGVLVCACERGFVGVFQTKNLEENRQPFQINNR